MIENHTWIVVTENDTYKARLCLGSVLWAIKVQSAGNEKVSKQMTIVIVFFWKVHLDVNHEQINCQTSKTNVPLYF